MTKARRRCGSVASSRTGLIRAVALSAACFVFSGGALPARSADRAGVEISDIDLAISPQGPVVLLKARNRAIPIFVDEAVAASIQSALTGEKLPRPLSHDLMKTILEAYAGKVTRVGITLKDGVFFADLTVIVNGAAKVFDSRSSDAIALAIRFKAPIVVGEDLLESAGKLMPGTGQML